jgi:CDP-diacylglycerol--glycerol-3-phosphate 3-phosphatidyltransferase
VVDIKRLTRTGAVGPARALGRLGLTPNALTIVGSLLTASVGLLAAQGWWVAAGLCVWLFSLTDTLDGALARATGRVTPFGAFLDSVCDRYAEAAVFLGVVWWYQSQVDATGVLLGYLAAFGSLMVSYARARAEGLDLHGEVGWFQRPERIVVLGAGFLLTALWPPALLLTLALLAVLTTVTVGQRLAHVAQQLRTRSETAVDGNRP